MKEKLGFPPENTRGYGADPFPVQRLVDQEQPAQRDAAPFMEPHTDDPFLIHQRQQHQQYQV